jgi:aspartyl-tRNA(Asn)/glutamyl-tRNA(Gln) amidotransferase subunit B
MDYEAVICFEAHVELSTHSKLFCRCSTMYGAPPNTQICPVCTGQPGALPVLNKKALEYGIRTGLALNCDINRISRFARKNYFYPDLPKGYQISQYEMPLCENGHLEITGHDGNPYRVGIKRIHLEEDAGKLVHASESLEASDYSLVDYNRASVPLLEIVADHTRNPLRSVKEARTYLERLRQLLRYLEVSECSMEKGQFRCDVNVSIRPKGTRGFGERSEIKNMASFKFIGDALEYEIKRQASLLESGGKRLQETRLFNEAKRITQAMRSKEDAPDYRYFPDPDLLEMEIDPRWVREMKAGLPELPDQTVNRLMDRYGVSEQDALLLTRDKDVSHFFERCAVTCEDRKRLSRWIIKDLFKVLKDSVRTIGDCPIRPRQFSRLVNRIVSGEITENVGRRVLDDMSRTGDDPDAIIAEKGLQSIRDSAQLARIVQEVISENPEIVSRIGSGEARLINFLIGQVMEKADGKAPAKEVGRLIRKHLRL